MATMTTIKQAFLAITTAALLLVLVVAPGAPASASEDFVTPPGITLMTEDELRSALVGNTLAGLARGTEWAEYYDSGGALRGLWGRTPVTNYGGNWSIRGSMFCLEYKYAEDSGCFTLSREDDKVYFFNLDGSRGKYPEAELKSGNPEGL